MPMFVVGILSLLCMMTSVVKTDLTNRSDFPSISNRRTEGERDIMFIVPEHQRNIMNPRIFDDERDVEGPLSNLQILKDFFFGQYCPDIPADASDSIPDDYPVKLFSEVVRISFITSVCNVFPVLSLVLSAPLRPIKLMFKALKMSTVYLGLSVMPTAEVPSSERDDDEFGAIAPSAYIPSILLAGSLRFFGVSIFEYFMGTASIFGGVSLCLIGYKIGKTRWCVRKEDSDRV